MSQSTSNDKGYFNLSMLILGSLILPISAVISVLIYILVFILSCFLKNYGKFISYIDVWMDEDFRNTPRSTLVITMAIQGDLSLNELRNLFKRNVLEARSTVNPDKLRYPEFKQFLTTFLCFRIWKNDINFLIENHIKEKSFDCRLSGENLLASVHQKYLNKLYKSHRSPWELILIRNVSIRNENALISSSIEQKSILVFRVHHVMADVKSVLKLLVECLGKKKLNTAASQIIKQKSIRNSLKFFAAYPINSLVEKIRFWNSVFKSYYHPWKSELSFGKQAESNFKMVVAFSPEIKMVNIKKVATENSVKTSAVLLSIIAGSVKKLCGNKWDKKVAISYPLPKPNHPEFLTNHMQMGTLCLATDQEDGLKRLELCNKEFVRVKIKQRHHNLNGNIIMCGIQIHPLSRFVTNIPVPIGVTNNAGDEEGFSIGNVECVDFRMSVGVLRGLQGVMFCIMSYKDGMRIAVIANESILEKETVQAVAIDLELELQMLMNYYQFYDNGVLRQTKVHELRIYDGELRQLTSQFGGEGGSSNGRFASVSLT